MTFQDYIDAAMKRLESEEPAERILAEVRLAHAFTAAPCSCGRPLGSNRHCYPEPAANDYEEIATVR